jgi:hypothetical protein
MSVKNRPITRRTVLRGVGAIVGLPLLDAMRSGVAFGIGNPAGAADDRPPVRMACLFWPNGCNPRTWTPKGEGNDFELSPILSPLARHKDDILVFTRLSNRGTFTGDGHYVKDAAWLTGTTIHRTTGADLNSGGVSMDQLAAKRIGVLTPIPSLELGVEPVTTGVDTNVGYTRLYGSHISWSSPTTPVAREINPKLAFDRLFRARSSKDGGPTRDDDKSVLDLVADDTRSLRNRIGHDDRRKLDEYLDSVRAVEKRIAFEASDRRAQYRDDAQARKDIETLGGRVDTYKHDPGRLRERSVNHTEQVQLMLDILLLALQTDATRVATFMFGNSVSNKNFSFVEGVKGGHHELSHHENNEEKLAQYQRITTWHMDQCARLLDRMKQIREGEGTLLDNAMVLIGSALRDGNAHDPHNLPTVLAGRAGGTLAPGRHLTYAKDTPLCNLYVSMLSRLGAPVPRFADSTGPLEGLDNPEYKGLAVG